MNPNIDFKFSMHYDKMSNWWKKKKKLVISPSINKDVISLAHGIIFYSLHLILFLLARLSHSNIYRLFHSFHVFRAR